MKNIKILIGIIMVMCSVVFSGCEKISNTSAETTTEAIIETTEATSTEHNVKDITLSENVELDDSQSYFDYGLHPIAKSETGYYYVEDSLLRYYDSSTQSSIPLCTKANCKHTKSDCMANLNTNAIYYYNGYIYNVNVNAGTAQLVRIEKDGRNRQTVANLCVSGSRVPSVVFCNGYAYYIPEEATVSDEEKSISIMRVSTDGGKPETVYEYSALNPSIGELKCYGNNIYMVIKEYEETYNVNTDEENTDEENTDEENTDEENTDEENTDEEIIKVSGTLIGKGIYCLNSETNDCECIIEDNVYSYCIDNENGQIYYFITGDGLYKYDVEEKLPTKLMEATDQSGMCALSFDGNHIYLNNISWKRQSRVFLHLDTEVTETLWEFDTEGSLLQEIDMSELNCSSVYFGDSNNLFINSTLINGQSGIFYINKENIGSGDWNKL